MKKQIVWMVGLLLAFYPFLETKAQQPDQPPIIQQGNLNLGQQGPTETSVNCGGNRYDLVCNSVPDNRYLQILGSAANDNIKLSSGSGSSVSTCNSEGLLTLRVYRACPNAFRITIYTYAGNDRIDASVLSTSYSLYIEAGPERQNQRKQWR